MNFTERNLNFIKEYKEELSIRCRKMLEDEVVRYECYMINKDQNGRSKKH